MMKTRREKAFDRLDEMEAELSALTAPLAEEIAKPFPKRDADGIRAAWSAIDAYRAEYFATVNRIKGIEKPSKRLLKLRRFEEAQAMYDKAQTARRRHQDWVNIGKMVLYHADPAPTPLIDWSFLHTTDPLLNMLDMGFHRIANLNSQDEGALEAHCFPDIPMPATQFDQLVCAAYRLLLVQGRAKEARFVDVGCGGGTRVYLANRFFRYCDGIDYDPGYVDAARKFFAAVTVVKMNAYEANGLTYEGYGNYDVIYFYRPMNQNELLGQLERKIIGDARPGTIILAPFSNLLEYRAEIECARVDGPIFIAGVSQQEADEMHEAARYSDTRLVASASDFVYDPGFWAPLIDASSYDISST